MSRPPVAGRGHRHARRRDGRRRARGLSLAECLIALALLSLAAIMVTATLAAARVTGERLFAQRRALQAAENALEAVRGGALPLASGPVDAGALVGDVGDWQLTVTLLVDDPEPPGLYRVAAEASFEVGGRPGVRRLETLVWRP
jgi:type II secretory pathway pseudopilin PulG